MIDVTIPGYGRLQLEHLLLDYNGTLAVDGRLLDGVGERLSELALQLSIHVLTADTFGHAGEELADVDCQLTILPPGEQDERKRAVVRRLGAVHCVCVGNGRNDRLMLQEAALGIAVLMEEGAATTTLMVADIVTPDILAALDLLRHPLRLTATLRS